MGAERIRGIVAGLEMKYALTRWRSDNLRGDHDRSVHAPPRIPVLEPGCLEPAPGTERGPLQLIDARTGIMPFASSTGRVHPRQETVGTWRWPS